MTKSSALPKCRYRLGAYVRLSPSDEIREEGSLVSHPQRIRGYVDFKNSQQPNWGEVVEVYTDKDYSGKDTNRPAFRRMLQDVKDGRLNAVIVTELSRISRDVKDFCNVWEFLKAHSATFISLKEQFDTSTPIGEMMVIQAVSFAQFERKTIVQRIKEGARARAERGLSSGGNLVLGLERHPTKKHHLIVNEDEAVTVRLMFQKFLELGCLAKLRDYLNEAGYRTKSYMTLDGKQRGGLLWRRDALHDTLTNIRYTGKVEVNKSSQGVPDEELSQHERYKMVAASWPAIIDDKVFLAVQQKLTANRRDIRNSIHHYRLSGLVYCGHCGVALSGQSNRGNGGRYFYYGHSRKETISGRHKERCIMERVPAVRLEELIVERLQELHRDTSLLATLVGRAKEGFTDSTKEMDQLIATKRQERQKASRQLTNLSNVLAEAPEGIQVKTLLTKSSDLEMLCEQLDQAIADLEAQKVGNPSEAIKENEVLKLFRGFKKDFGKFQPAKQREMIRTAVSRITVSNDGVVHAQYFGSPKQDAILGHAASKAEGTLLGLTDDLPQNESSPAGDRRAASHRTMVCSVSEVVGIHRFELWTPPV